MITYNEAHRMFHLRTKNTSYQIAIVDREGFVCHSYYGPALSEEVIYPTGIYSHPFTPETNARDRLSFLDAAMMEYPTHGIGDFRQSAIRIEDAGGNSAMLLTYVRHEIMKGKEKLPGLPATFGDEANVETLKIVTKDTVLNLRVELYYSVFSDTDAIASHVEIYNDSDVPCYLKKAMSGCMELSEDDYDVITMHGCWARERALDRRALGYGVTGVYSLRGESGHQDHPFMAICSKNATEDTGAVYAVNFVYSGNYSILADKAQFGTVRVLCGINPEDFTWKLESRESFVTPEMIRVYSAGGFNRMTQAFHDLYRNHLIRSPYLHKERPILINNWEATYFDFTTEKLLSIAKEASKLGIEMLVMDDGWFGERDTDNLSLGDWFVNERKLPGGLKKLVDGVNAYGMKFGIWFEPEMISPNSDLYRAHPDWAITVPGREPGLARNQLVLDYSREDVTDAVYDMISAILHSAHIEYVKWDMNRPLCDMNSLLLPKDRKGEQFHRYVLGVYRLQERLITEFPELLLENCSGGGGRFDPGMLYYSPQIWCSDDTDAVERLKIQEATALIYPLSTMGAHVSDCPNHTVGRTTPFEMRGYVALAGTFGYELDVTKIPQADRDMIPAQTRMYHRFHELVSEGDYYRLASYSVNHLYDAYMVAKKDGSEALLTFSQVKVCPSEHSHHIKLKGLIPDAKYKIYQLSMTEEAGMVPVSAFSDTKEHKDETYLGSTLENVGLYIGGFWGDFNTRVFYLSCNRS